MWGNLFTVGRTMGRLGKDHRTGRRGEGEIIPCGHGPLKLSQSQRPCDEQLQVPDTALAQGPVLMSLREEEESD